MLSMENQFVPGLLVLTILAFTGGLIIIFGYLIRFERRGHLINGYKETNYTNADKYLDRIGMTLLLSGFVFLIIGVAVLIFRIHEWVFASATIISIGCMFTSLFYNERRFRIKK
ncbi:MAG: hypothetical protein COA82_02350 [Alkaliphilus sp.]|nr:MAG: hypothetical protein COA82_02350 [Alkaliphilus sp.]